MKGLNPFALLIAGIFILALSSLMFMFAWNVFVFDVLGFTRPINIIEALAGSIGLNLITSTVGQIVKKWANEKD